MEDQSLCVFAQEREAIPLRILRDTLQAAGYPAGIGVDIAGEATDAELDATDWEAAFLRWSEPELHEVALIERNLPDEDEQAAYTLAKARQIAKETSDVAGGMIVREHLGKTQAVYVFQILPALLTDDDHLAWIALDAALRCVAENTNGLIYAQEEGFYDADGEMMLVEGEELPDGVTEE